MPNSPEQIEVYGQKHPIRKILILLFILSGVLSLWHIDHNKTGITGFFIAQNMQEFTIDLRETYNQTTEYVLPLDYTKDFYLTGLTISGVFIGDTGSYFRVYLEDLTGKRFFVTGSESAQKNLLGITGRFATELNETTNTTVLQYNITQNNSIKLKYYDKSKFDPENDGIEAPNGVIDFTVEDSDIPNTTNICTLWKINSLETSSITNTCAGQCCEQLGIEAFSQEWKTPFATHIGKDNTTKNNEVYAKIVGFTNDTIPQIIQTQWDHLPARFIDSYIAFSQACTETCLLPAGITGPELKLVLEISEGELVVNLVEGTIKEYEKNKTNLAYNKIKEDPRYDVIIDNVQKDGRDLLVKGHHTQLQGNLTVRVIGKVNYSIINVQAAGYEEFVVRIPNYKNEYFKIKVGDQTEEFAFGIPKTVAVEAVVSASNGSDLPVEVAVIDETINEQIISAQGPRPGVQIKEGTYKLTLEPQNNPIKKIEMPIEIYANETIQLGMEEVPTERVTINSENVIETYALDTSKLPSNATITVTATGKELWKCKTWIFKKQECPEGWEKIRDVEPGKDYTIELNPTDPAFSETIQPNDGKTTYIDEDDNDNYGSTNKLRVKAGSGEQRKALLEFNISNIPNNAKILDAQLEITKKSGGSQTVTVKRITESWTENGATWEKKDGATNWASEGGSYASTIYATTNVGSGSDQPYQWNITKLLQEWVNETNANYGVILTGDSSSNTEFYSDDETNTNKRPRLTLNYSTPLVVQIVNPLSGTVVNSSSFYVNITANGNISSAVLEINGTNLTMTGSLSHYFALVNLANGTYNLKAFATDAQTGEIRLTPTINVTVSIALTLPPNVTITDNSSTPRKNDTVRFVINAEDASNLSNATFSWNGTGVWTNETYALNGTSGQVTLNKQVILSKNSVIGYYATVTNKQGASNQSNLKLISVKDTPPNKPQIVTPTNGTRLNQNSVLIVWTNVTDVDEDIVSYVVEITNSTIIRMVSTTNNSQPTILADGENKFRVLSSTSDANSSFSDTISIMLDQTPPSLNVSGLNNNSFTNKTAINVQVTQSETGTLNLIINNLLNISTTNLSSTFLILLNEGINTITFTTNDSAGNTNNASFVIKLDTKVPQINVTGISQYLIRGNAYDENSEILKINDTRFILTTTGINWTITNGTTLSDGTYHVLLSLNDSAGNLAKVEVNLTIDNTAPIINVSGLLNQSYTRNISLYFNVTQSETATLTLLVNGINNFSTTNLTANLVTMLSEGTNTITLQANDSTNNTNQLSYIINLDTIAPVINITKIRNHSRDVIVEGKTFDLNQETLTVNDSQFLIIQIEQNWTLLNNTEINEGTYSVQLRLNDTAGNIAGVSINFTIDRSPPNITVVGIQNNLITNNRTFIVNTTNSEQGTTQLILNQLLNITTSNNSNVFIITLNEGNNTILYRANDSAGNYIDLNYTVKIDTSPPILNVTGIKNSTIAKRNLNVSVNVSEPARTRTYINTTLLNETQNQTSTQNIELNEGKQTILIETTDTAGNAAQQNYLINVDTIKPQINITKINRLTSKILIEGLAEDENLDTIKLNDTRFTLQGLQNWSITNNTNLNDGNYTIIISLNDTAGNQNTVQLNFTYDQTPPKILTVGPLNNTESYRNFTIFNQELSDDISGVKNCTLNATERSGQNSFYNIQNGNQRISLNSGNYTWFVECSDNAGNSNKTKESQLRVTVVELYGEVFTNKSNITDVDPLNVTGLFVEKANIGKVEYKKNLSFKRTVNLSQAIKIEKGEITINSSEYPELNSSAILTIHGINYLIPVIVRDNEECKSSECTLIQAGGGTLIFEVTHFSTYSVKESNSVLAAVGHRPPAIKGVSPAQVPEYKIQVELPCKENWNCTTWSNCKNVQTRKCIDLNKCGTEEHLPVLEQACYEPICIGNWTCTEWGSCSKGNKTRTCTDQNNCSNNDMPEIVKACRTPQLTSDTIREAVRSTPDKWFIPFTLLLLVILIAVEILTRKKIKPAPINRRKKRINRRRKRKRKKRRSKT